MLRTYSELITFKTFAERFRYLRLDGRVGEETFGRSRYLNQVLYHSDAWDSVRNQVIIRDNACDLGLAGYDIFTELYIHHMNPITEYDLQYNMDMVLNPEYLVCTCLGTHNAIHYGDETYLMVNRPVQRQKGDTCPWKVF